MPLKPQSAKSKGRRLQQRVARDIRAAFPHLQEDDVVSTSMGANGEDVRLSPLARASLPLSLECKCQERSINVWACLDQARSNCPDGAAPCVVFSRNRADTYAVVPWRLLLDLHRRVASGGDGALPSRLAALLREVAAWAPAASEEAAAAPAQTESSSAASSLTASPARTPAPPSAPPAR
jgi:hypothetical protein